MFRIILMLSLLLLGLTVCFAQTTDDTQDKVVFKEGTQFSVKLKKSLDVNKVKAGDTLDFELVENLQGNGVTIEKGSTVSGRILEAQKISAEKKVSTINITFDFIKYGEEEILMFVGTAISMKEAPEGMKIEDVGNGNTVFSLEGKNILLESSKQLRIKIIDDVKLI